MRTSYFSSGERNILRWIVLFVIVSRILLMFRSEERIYTRPYMEDSFYLFNCAEHFAHGEGFTCDGKQPTNGVQPLIVVFYAPLFLIAGANKLLALKLGFILIALFDSLSVIFIAKLIRLLQKKPEEAIPVWKSAPIIAAILWAGLYPVLVHTANGLETGLYSTLLLASLFYYARISRLRSDGNWVSFAQWIILGIILGLTVLARIDAVFLVTALAGFELYKFKGKGFLNGAIISSTAFFISSPWWYYNYHVFGSIMPQSGMAESLGTGTLAENVQRGAIVIGDILSVFFFLPNYELPAWFHFFWLIAMVAIVLWAAKRFALRNYLKENFSLLSLTPFYYFCGTLVVYYIFFFSAPYFLPRYFQPLRILLLILFSIALPKLIEVIRNSYSNQKKIAFIFITSLCIAVISFSAGFYLYYFTIGHLSDFYLTGKWALLHSETRIGMAQSGTAGFIAPNVVNLDGKVNFAALRAKKKNDIGEYIEYAKLDYIADWREFAEQMVLSAAKHGGKFQETDSIGRVIIFKRRE